jgi:hypothetical protein
MFTKTARRNNRKIFAEKQTARRQRRPSSLRGGWLLTGCGCTGDLSSEQRGIIAAAINMAGIPVVL